MEEFLCRHEKNHIIPPTPYLYIWHFELCHAPLVSTILQPLTNTNSTQVPMYKGDLRDFTRLKQPPENRKANVSPQLFPFFPEPHKISF